MSETLDLRRIGTYLLFAFGITWLFALAIYLTGGLANSPEVMAGIPLSLVLITLSMFGPALAHLLTRLVTREGWGGLWLRARWREGWRYWLLAWFLPPLLILAGALLYFALFPHHFDPSLSLLREQVAAAEVQTGQTVPLPLELLVLLQLGAGVLLAPLLNAIPILGEEFGWRAYLQPKLLPLGERRMYLLMGIIWGAWHWPIIAMGYNFGLDYPGAPWTGLLMMTWFTFVVGTFLGWATLRAGSVWPAVIGHGVINGVGQGSAIFLAGEPNTLLGPLPVGLLGGLGFSLVALWLLWRVVPRSRALLQTPTTTRLNV